MRAWRGSHADPRRPSIQAKKTDAVAHGKELMKESDATIIELEGKASGCRKGRAGLDEDATATCLPPPAVAAA